MNGLRKRGKERRRGEIVAAAAALWRRHGVDKVSIAQIAEAAEVAPQTIYNLFGGQDALIFAAIETLLDRLDAALAALESDGIMRSIDCVRISAHMFRDDAALYRQLIVRIPKAMFDGAHYSRDSAQIQVAAIATARACGDLVGQAAPDALGRQIFIGYMGALYAWACGGLDGPAFTQAAELAALLPLCAMASNAARPLLQAAIAERLDDDVASARATIA